MCGRGGMCVCGGVCGARSGSIPTRPLPSSASDSRHARFTRRLPRTASTLHPSRRAPPACSGHVRRSLALLLSLSLPLKDNITLCSRVSAGARAGVGRWRLDVHGRVDLDRPGRRERRRLGAVRCCSCWCSSCCCLGLLASHKGLQPLRAAPLPRVRRAWRALLRRRRSRRWHGLRWRRSRTTSSIVVRRLTWKERDVHAADVDGAHMIALAREPTGPADVLPGLPTEPLAAERFATAASDGHAAQGAPRSPRHRVHVTRCYDSYR